MKTKKAFTLIELLVVIAIIGILATVSIIALANARAKSRDAKRAGDMKQIQTALELFFNDKNRYPTAEEWASGKIFSTTTDSTSTYMAMIPAAPVPSDGNCTNDQNSINYTPTDNGGSYSISFCLGNTTGTLTPGPKCLTPGGIVDVDCGPINSSLVGFTNCGDSGTYQGETYTTASINGECWINQNMNVGAYIGSSATEAGYDGTYGTNDDCHALNLAETYYWSCQGASGIQKYCYLEGTDGGDPANCNLYGALYEWAESVGLPYHCNYTTYNCDGADCIASCDGSDCVVGDYSDCNFPDPTNTPRQGICPTGWHLPSTAEYNSLAQFANTDPGCDLESGPLCDTAGGKLKASVSHNPVAWDGGDDYGFSALPAGSRDYYSTGFFEVQGLFTSLWSASPQNPGLLGRRIVLSDGSDVVEIYDTNRSNGYSVRCLQD